VEESQIARMFYKGQKQLLGRSSILSRDATEITPMAGYVIKSSGSCLHFIGTPVHGEISDVCRKIKSLSVRV